MNKFLAVFFMGIIAWYTSSLLISNNLLTISNDYKSFNDITNVVSSNKLNYIDEKFKGDILEYKSTRRFNFINSTHDTTYQFTITRTMSGDSTLTSIIKTEVK